MYRQQITGQKLQLSKTRFQSQESSLSGILDIVPTDYDIKLGNNSAAKTEKELGGLLNDTKITAYVSAVGKKVAANSKLPTLPYTFHVINSKVINAFALPGGRVYVTKGLLDTLSTEAQLAAVLGHEISHAAARHGIQQLGVSAGLNTVSLAIAGNNAAKSVITGLVSNLATSKYSRDQESEADVLGLAAAVKSGYNPFGAIEVMQILQAKGGKQDVNWFASHPMTSTRIAELRGTILGSGYTNTGEVGAERYQAIMGRTVAEKSGILGLPSWVIPVIIAIPWTVIVAVGLAMFKGKKKAKS